MPMEWVKLLSLKTQVERTQEPGTESWADYPISDFEQDYKSIISSASFRRLQDKTQVFPLDKSDFVRTRLTHSVEVSTIAKQLGIMVTQNKKGYVSTDFSHHSDVVSVIPSVLSCAGLLHDLGNPPFGHFGEVVIRDWFRHELDKDDFSFKGTPVRDFLNSQMKNDLCNFEGNAQALRILSKIKNNPNGYDANLTYSVINTLIKYPTDSENISEGHNDVKFHKLGYFLSEKELFESVCHETGTYMPENGYARHPLTFLMEAADDIAYATSDLEDALKKGMFTVDQFIAYFKEEAGNIPQENRKMKSIELISNLEGRIRNLERNRENDLVAFQKWTEYTKKWLMYVVAYSFSRNYTDIMQGVYQKDMFFEGFHRYSIEILKKAMAKFVFDSPQILKLELAAKKILSSLLSDFIYAVLYWRVEDDTYKMTKAQKKIVNIISENYKNDYLYARSETDETKNLYLRFMMVTDYISGMTDSFAKNLYQELNGIY